MVETIVSSTFNFFDIFVRLGPGCILLGCYYCCFAKIIPNMNLDDLSRLILNVSIAYIVGTLLKAPSRLFTKQIDKVVFGGNPRDIYTKTFLKEEENKEEEKSKSKFKKWPVIKEDITRKLAEDLVNSIISNDSAFKESNFSNERKAHHAFSHMVNCLELKGKSNKSDRICSLVDMCASVTVALFFCVLMLTGSIISLKMFGFDLGLNWNFNPHSGFITFLLLLVGMISSGYLYVHYTQVRFSMIIIQYNLWKNK